MEGTNQLSEVNIVLSKTEVNQKIFPFCQDASKFYLAGYSIVPLESNGKKPIKGLNLRTYFSNLPTRLEFDSWLKNYPDSNIGLITGQINNLLVIDCDNSEAIDFWLKLIYGTSSRDMLKNLVAVKTRPDGSKMHLYYAYPKNPEAIKFFKTKSRLFGNNSGIAIDVRSDYGYVVAPYSFRQGIGFYAFLDKNMERMFFSRDLELPGLPGDAHLRCINKIKELEQGQSRANKQHYSYSVNQVSDEWRQRITELTELPIRHHTRDDRLFAISCSLKRFGLSDDDATTILEFLIDNVVEQVREDIYRTENGKIKVKSASRLLQDVEAKGENNKPTKADKAIITGLFNNIRKYLKIKGNRIKISDNLEWHIKSKANHELINLVTGEIYSFKISSKGQRRNNNTVNASFTNTLDELTQLIDNMADDGDIEFYISQDMRQMNKYGMLVRFKDFDGNYKVTLLGNENFRIYIQRKFRDKYGKPFYFANLSEFANKIQAIASSLAKIVPQYIYRAIARDGKYYYLVNPDNNEILEISSEGLRLINGDEIELPFIHDFEYKGLNFKEMDRALLKKYNISNTLELLKVLFPQLAKDRDAFILTTAWLLQAMIPDEGQTYFHFMVNGQRGSGKTTFCKALKEIIDASDRDMAQQTDDDFDFHLILDKERVIILDNLDSIKQSESDLYCRVATGSTISKRKFYTQSELVDIKVRSSIIFNGINNPIFKSDLASRVLKVNFKSFNELGVNRLDIHKFKQLMHQFVPMVRAELFRCLAKYLEKRDEYELTKDEDIARSQELFKLIKVVASEIKDFPFTFKEFIQTYSKAINNLNKEILEQDKYIGKLIDYLDSQNFDELFFTTKDLWETLKEKYSDLRYDSHFTIRSFGKRIGNYLEYFREYGYEFRSGNFYIDNSKRARGWLIKRIKNIEKGSDADMDIEIKQQDTQPNLNASPSSNKKQTNMEKHEKNDRKMRYTKDRELLIYIGTDFKTKAKKYIRALHPSITKRAVKLNALPIKRPDDIINDWRYYPPKFDTDTLFVVFYQDVELPEIERRFRKNEVYSITYHWYKKIIERFGLNSSSIVGFKRTKTLQLRERNNSVETIEIPYMAKAEDFIKS